MRRSFARLSPLAALALCVPAQAIIRYADGDANSHTTQPTGTFANAGWQWEGQFGLPSNDSNAYVATAIGPHTFITAAHVGGYLGTGITYHGVTYPVISTSLIGGTDPSHSNANRRDILVATVGGAALTSWAPLYNEAVDGSMIGRTSFMVGRGTQRADEIHVTTSRGAEGTLRGWNWGTYDNVQRWGTNVVAGFDEIDDTHPTPNTGKEYVYSTFDANGLPDEGMLSNKDSGGGLFVQSASGAWKLAGVASNVEADYRFDANGINPDGDGAIFDFRDLYEQAQDHTWHPAQDFQGNSVLNPIPAHSYWANISDVLSTASPGDANDDGTVNTADFNMLASNFNLQSGGNWLLGDFNGDGAVNALDFNVLATNYGNAVSVTSAVGTGIVPEPGTVGLIVLSTIALRRRLSSTLRLRPEGRLGAPR